MTQRIIFAGTPDFAAVHLKAMIDAGFTPVAVYTQPDRPAGRGHKLTPSPVKELALQHGIEVRTPVNFKNAEDVEAFRNLNADLAVVVAYGLLLPQEVIDAPRLGCINIHASLLPEWRGAAPIQRALLSGQKETGVTVMQIVKALDAGDILCKEVTEILKTDTSGVLFERLALCGAKCLIRNLPDILEGKIKPVPQDPDKVSYAAKLSKDEAAIDFTDSAAKADLKIRGLNPWPVAVASLEGTVYKIFAGKDLSEEEAAADLHLAQEEISAAEAGAILGVSSTGIAVKCGSGVLYLVTIQAPGKGRVSAADYGRSRKDLFVRGKRFE